MDKIISVSIIGCGSRGGNTYGTLMNKQKDKFKIVSLCDLRKDSLLKFAKEFDVSLDNCFNDEDEFFKEKRSDLLVIATLDDTHVKVATKAIKLGYKILLEKPISANVNELNDLLKLANEYHSFIMVCHVLRYTWSNNTIMEILNSKRLGDLVQIDQSEQVGYWHFAHSYVRGNWRNTNVSAPMIMAKSCHDLDLIVEYANSKAEAITSFGTLNLFKKENMPKGASNRCLNCIYKDSCAYSATRQYIDKWHKDGCPQCWPYNVISTEYLTEDVIIKALENGPYGRCVFACDNNVADNQTVAIKFKNGVQANLKVSAYTYGTGRITILNCTYGQIIYDESKKQIAEKPFGKEEIIYNYNESDEFGHGGGDVGIVNSLYDVLTGKTKNIDTSLENSIESHLLAIAAEDSRNNDGKLIYLKDYR